MTFPAGFNQIGASAFASASNLTTLIFKGENTPYVENINAFSTPGAIDVIVPYGTPLDGASSWRRTPWTSFKSVTMASLSSGVDVPGATERNVAVYPSVATTEICLTGIDRMQTVCVYDITGQKVEEIEVAGNRENRISVARLIPGMYLLKTENTVLKFIKK
jgi:hypothetical protein